MSPLTWLYVKASYVAFDLSIWAKRHPYVFTLLVLAVLPIIVSTAITRALGLPWWVGALGAIVLGNALGFGIARATTRRDRRPERRERQAAIRHSGGYSPCGDGRRPTKPPPKPSDAADARPRRGCRG